MHENDRLPLKPLDKIRVVNTYVYSKIKWEFSIYKLSTAWVKLHLDNILHAESDTGLTFNLVLISAIWNNQHKSWELIYPFLVIFSCRVKQLLEKFFPNPKTQTFQKFTMTIYNDNEKKINIGTNTIIERANSSTNENKKQIWKKIIEQEKKNKSWCHFINLKKKASL